MATYYRSGGLAVGPAATVTFELSFHCGEKTVGSGTVKTGLLSHLLAIPAGQRTTMKTTDHIVLVEKFLADGAAGSVVLCLHALQLFAKDQSAGWIVASHHPDTSHLAISHDAATHRLYNETLVALATEGELLADGTSWYGIRVSPKLVAIKGQS
jgi:hypothetical protein